MNWVYLKQLMEKIENGQTSISAERLVKLSGILEVDITELISSESIKYINNKEHHGDVGLVINKTAFELHKELINTKNNVIAAKDTTIKAQEETIKSLNQLISNLGTSFKGAK